MTQVFKGATDQTFYFKMVDSTAGTPETGLTITSIDATYTRSLSAAVKNDLTALAAVTTAHTDNKGIEIDATNAPGLYRVDFPDAAFATGADKVILNLTCTGCDPPFLMIDLVNVNSQVAYVPNAAAGAAGGLPVSAAGSLDLDARLDAAVSSRMASYTQPTGFLTATFPAGTVANTTNITAGTITTVTNLTNAPTAGDLTATMKTSVTTAATAATPVAASVTGAVGSVTGLTASNLDASISSVKAKTDLIPGTSDGLTFAQKMTLFASVLLGKASGLATTTAIYRAADDAKDRVTATVDADGNRTAVTLDAA